MRKGVTVRNLQDASKEIIKQSNINETDLESKQPKVLEKKKHPGRRESHSYGRGEPGEKKGQAGAGALFGHKKLHSRGFSLAGITVWRIFAFGTGREGGARGQNQVRTKPRGTGNKKKGSSQSWIAWLGRTDWGCKNPLEGTPGK